MKGERVLLAEDDPLVGAVLVPVLEELDCEVVHVQRGDEALFQLEADRFTIVVTDLKMPGAPGMDVLTRARAKDVATRLIAISGYADDDVRRAVEALGGVLLHKPFGVNDLRELVLRTVD